MTAVIIQLALFTIASAIGLAVLLWAMTTDRMPDGEGF
jgi:nitrogen fixation-related uncharacterized protein